MKSTHVTHPMANSFVRETCGRVEVERDEMNAEGTQHQQPKLADRRLDNQRAVVARIIPEQELKMVLQCINDTGLLGGKDVEKITWDDVFDEMDNTRDAYISKGERNVAIKVLRHGKTLQTAFEPLVGLIPDQYGLNVIRACLVVLVKMLQQRQENREKIFHTLESIPYVIRGIGEILRVIPADDTLKLRVREMYEQVVYALAGLIPILLCKQKETFPVKMWKSIPFVEAETIETLTHKIWFAVDRVHERLEVLDQHRRVEGYQTTKRVLNEMIGARQTANETNRGVHTLTQEQRSGFAEMKDLLETRGSLAANQVPSSIRNAMHNSIASPNANIIIVGRDFICPPTQISGIPRSPVDSRRQPPPPSPQILNALARALNITDVYRILTDDLEQVLHEGATIDEEALGRGRHLMVEDDFKTWLNLSSSDNILLVDGYCADLGNGMTTPVSVFCAQLAVVMQHVGSFVPLAVFCSQHTSGTDALAGPRGVLLGMIVELIARLGTPSRIESFITPTLLKDIALRDAAALARLFRFQLEQIPSELSIFIILDNMSELEDTLNGWEEDLRLLVDTLHSIVYEKSAPAVKVLMTFGNKSVEICDYLPGRHKQLSLQADNLENGSTSSDDFSREMFATLFAK